MKKSLLLIFTLVTMALQSQNQVESSISEYYDGTSWSNSYGTNYEYDGNNNLTVETEFIWELSAWKKAYKTDYTYNANNKVTQVIYFDWNESQWVNVYKDVYTYNAGGYLTQITEQVWNGFQWVNSYEVIVTYNNGLPVTSLYTIWTGSQWVNDERSFLTYSGNNLIQVISEDWNGSAWINDYRDLVNYNANNQITNNIFQMWNGTSWEEESSTTYTLDANGNRLNEISSYDGSSQYKIEYNYDFSSLLSNFAHPFKDKTGVDYLTEDFPHVNKVIGDVSSIFDTSTNTYDIYGRTTYNYNNPLTLEIADVELREIKLYPNPATNYIKISGLTNTERISIYNVLGVKTLEMSINDNDPIDIKELSNGLYFLKFENGNTMRFIKK